MLEILNPVNGKVVKAKKIKDPTFAKEMMGPTIGVIPTDNKFVAPIDGKILIADGHAYSIENKDKTQVLVHIGIDTVEIDPKAKKKIFKYLKKKGNSIKAGQPIVEVDLAAIEKLGFDTITSVVVLSESVVDRVVKVLTKGKLEVKTPILSVN